MSRHREAVHELASALGDAAASEVSDVVAQQLLAAGQLEAVIALFAEPRSPSPILDHATSRLATIVRSSSIADVYELDVAIRLSPRERVGHCVAGRGGTSRRFQMVDVAVKARIRTRWLHLWEERQVTRQWVLG